MSPDSEPRNRLSQETPPRHAADKDLAINQHILQGSYGFIVVDPKAAAMREDVLGMAEIGLLTKRNNVPPYIMKCLPTAGSRWPSLRQKGWRQPHPLLAVPNRSQNQRARAETRALPVFELVGEEGFEPSASASRTLRAKPSCATPRRGLIVTLPPDP